VVSQIGYPLYGPLCLKKWKKKFLIKKIVIIVVKAECSRLETEREQLQQTADSLQNQLEASEISLKQAQQDFQQERTNSDIKHKYKPGLFVWSIL